MQQAGMTLDILTQDNTHHTIWHKGIKYYKMP